jgi:hypothetical protein
MSSTTLLEEIVAEAKLHNPNIAPEEISEGIAIILSKEILPEVMKNLSLPKFPSYREVHSTRIKEKRQVKADMLIDLGDRRSLIQQIEQVRTEMGWDGVDDLRPITFGNNSPSIYYIPETGFSVPIETPIKKPDFKDDLEETEKEAANSTSQKMPKEPEKNIISLSETAQRKIVTDPLFEAVFKTVEIQLRNIIASRNLGTKIDVVCKSDVEISSWKKCILEVHPPSDLDFQARMNISTIFDIVIRKTIKDLKKDADEDTREYLKNLNRNLFVHIDL